MPAVAVNVEHSTGDDPVWSTHRVPIEPGMTDAEALQDVAEKIGTRLDAGRALVFATSFGAAVIPAGHVLQVTLGLAEEAGRG